MRPPVSPPSRSPWWRPRCIRSTPLPGSVPAVSYGHDDLFAVSLAGDALHHWPPGDPHVAGLPFRYHWFAHLHIAAAAQVAHVPLATIVMRLAPLLLAALFVLLAVEAGSALTGSVAAGVAAAAVPLFASELDLDPQALAPFNGLFFTSVWLSPSLLLGLVLFRAGARARCGAARSPPARAARAVGAARPLPRGLRRRQVGDASRAGRRGRALSGLARSARARGRSRRGRLARPRDGPLQRVLAPSSTGAGSTRPRPSACWGRSGR